MSIIDSILGFAGGHEALEGPLKELNRAVVNHVAGAIPARPRAFSLWSPVTTTDPAAKDYITDYTSWPSLTDRNFSGRHLPPAEPKYTSALPQDLPFPYGLTDAKVGDITRLFTRENAMKESRSSLLFMFFAQWFTDSILRIDAKDRRRNNSNHDIDLCQIYGLTEKTARLLRFPNGRGKLRSQIINGEEYLDYLCELDATGGFKVREDFMGLEVAKVGLSAILADGFNGLHPDRREKLYATGLERGNSSIGYVAISTIFMREHNRIAGELALNNGGWNDERIFQTARNINIVLLMKLIVEEYINHIVGHRIFKLDHEFAEGQHWYRGNWIALEFDLLYRWHGLAPDSIQVDGAAVPAHEFRNNNALLEAIGIGPLIQTVSMQSAGKIGLLNTPNYLWGAEYQSCWRWLNIDQLCRLNFDQGLVLT